MTPEILAERKKIHNILIVDDEPVLADLAEHFLERENFCTDAAYSADEALQKISQYPYDAIVSDYQMPGKDGIDLLKEVRRSYPGLPFILFTGRSREEVAIQALNEGADFYIQKGGDPKAQFAELTHHVKRAIERRNAAAAIQERNEVLGAILSASPFGIALVKSRTIQWLNDSLASMLGYETRELLGMPVRNLYGSEEDFVSAGERIAAELNRNGQSKIRVRLKRKNGSMMDCEAQMACLSTKNPLYSRMVTFTDITRQLTLTREMEHLSGMPDTNPGAVLEVNDQGIVTFFNNAAIDLLVQHGSSRGLEVFVPQNTQEILKEFRTGSASCICRTIRIGSATLTEHIIPGTTGNTIRISLS
jgi:PAS domain S-box-containing protein